MRRHQWRQQVKSLFEKHVDQDQREQLKKTRKDMEDRKEKIIRLVKDEEQDGSNGRSKSLQELVKDYHKEYESLYELYRNLTGELKKKVYSRNEDKEKFSSSSSDSDSDEDRSPKRKGGKNGDLQNDVDQERLQLISENDELKARLEELTKEKSILTEEKESAIKRAEEAEANVLELKDNVDGLKNDIEKEWEPKTVALTSKLNDLEKEGERLSAQKRELEEQLINKSSEASDQMKEVFDQLNNFQKELMTLATIKAEMETELERKSHEVSENMNQIGNLTGKLANSEADQKRIIEEKNSIESEVVSLHDEKSKLEEEIRTVTTENTELRSKVIDLEMNLRSAERNAEDLSKGNESSDQLIIELQTTIEDLKRDIEMDKDELMTIEEKNRNLEVMLRLSNQKLRVTEQLLSEKEASHNALEEKIIALSQTLESYSDMIREISEQANASLAALERAITIKFDEDNGGLAKRLSMVSGEVRSAKSWVVETRAENVVMKEKIEKLEMEAEKERVEKEEIVRKLSQMDKDVRDKEDRLLGLGDEKREAIKQLCVWIEYHRNRCVELKGMLLKLAPKVQRTR
ncbi:hypothetical protein V2J09_004802 [Rumex salicifolius]